MDLLKYEFQKAPADTYSNDLGLLVRKVRYYKNNRPVEDFNNVLPELHEMETKLQEKAKESGQRKRYYVQEIIDELSEEKDIHKKLLEKVTKGCQAIVHSLYDESFDLNDYSYELRKAMGVYWVQFFGYKAQRQNDSMLIVVKEVFRAACYDIHIVFIDSMTGQ